MLLAPIAIAVASLAFSVSDPLTIGSKLPKADHKMTDISGKQVSMKDNIKKNGVLVMFSCNTCPYVIKNQERTVKIAELASKLNVGVIILNSNEAQRSGEDNIVAMKKYAADNGYKWNYVVDQNHEVADAFGANRTPECFLFDKDMTLVYHGAIDDNPSDASAVTKNHLQNALTELSEGKAITVKESKSVGCTIKRNKS